MGGTNASGSPYFHSFNYGRVHFLAFDIDQDYQVDSPQYQFITADLAAVNRAVTPLVFAYEHFPLLCSNNFWCNDGSGSARECCDQCEAVTQSRRLHATTAAVARRQGRVRDPGGSKPGPRRRHSP